MARRKIIERAERLAQLVRQDGWANALTGLGTLARDKLMSSTFGRSIPLVDQTLEDMYHGSDMASRIVDKPIDDALRQGFGIKITTADDEEIGEARKIEASVSTWIEKQLHATERVAEAAAWGRLYGGGAIYVITEDPALPSEPLDVSKIRAVRSLLVLDKRDIVPFRYDEDSRSPTFGEPLVYQVVTSQGRGTQAVQLHASRLITFGGQRTGWRRKRENAGWSMSVLQRPYETLRAFDMTWQSVAHLMSDSSQGVFKMKGLIDMLAGGGATTVQERMRVVDMGRSVARALVIDAEGEDFERKETSLSGHAQVLREFCVRLAAAADMPVTVLLGQSPAGLNATGENDRDLWDNRVKTFQTLTLKPRLERLLLLVLSAKEGPTGGVVPDGWDVTFAPLRQMTEAETAALRKAVAETDAIYIDRGVVTAEEVALSRFSIRGWTMETEIDTEVREGAGLDDAPNPDDDEAPPADPDPAATTKPPALTPSAVGAIMTVNEARAQMGLAPVSGGDVTITEFQARNAATIAKAANAEAGDVPRGDDADGRPKR